MPAHPFMLTPSPTPLGEANNGLVVWKDYLLHPFASLSSQLIKQPWRGHDIDSISCWSSVDLWSTDQSWDHSWEQTAACFLVSELSWTRPGYTVQPCKSHQGFYLFLYSVRCHSSLAIQASLTVSFILRNWPRYVLNPLGLLSLPWFWYSTSL